MILLLALALACTQDGIDKGQPESMYCDSGLLDGSACVPESCGTGPWGNLPVDDETVYVDVNAGDGGDGTEATPFASIQAGLDQAGMLGGGLVAVAAGTYPELLRFTSDHADVHLAGRCRDLVILDASVGDGETPGVEIDAGYTSVEVDGLGISGFSRAGIEVASGNAVVRDTTISGGSSRGLVAFHGGFGVTGLVVDGCLIEGNTEFGLLASDSQISLRNTTIRGTVPEADGGFGWGVGAQEGAIVAVDDCLIEENTEVGLFVSGRGTQVTSRGTTVRDTQPKSNGEVGVVVQSDAMLAMEDCLIEGNTNLGLLALSSGVRVSLRDTTVRDTQPNTIAGSGRGIAVEGGATLDTEACVIEGNTDVGLYAQDPGSQVALRDTTVRGTHAVADGTLGIGIGILGGATLFSDGSHIEENSMYGIYVMGPGTQVSLRNTTVRDTRACAIADSGDGIGILDGATLVAEGCLIDRNTNVGVFAVHAGTRVSLRDTIVRETHPYAGGGGGVGIAAQDGASLDVDGCLIEGSTNAGLLAAQPGTLVTLRDSTVRGTRPRDDGRFGRGVEVRDAAVLVAEGCSIDRNTEIGIHASDPGTRVILRDSAVSRTEMGADRKASSALGIAVEDMALVTASRVVVAANQGPGLVMNGNQAVIECSGCSIEGNQFAGAVAVRGGTLSISESTIQGTTPNVNLLGGAGVYVWPWDGEPSTVVLTNNLIQDNPVAGVWLIGNGTYVITGNSISGGIGEAFGSGFRCGDAILAIEDVTAWDGTSGLLLQDNLLQGAFGAGVFLDASAALMSGNSYAGNSMDLVVQGQSCISIPGCYSEAPRSEFCPVYEHPTCRNEFFLVAAPGDLVE